MRIPTPQKSRHFRHKRAFCKAVLTLSATRDRVDYSLLLFLLYTIRRPRVKRNFPKIFSGENRLKKLSEQRDSLKRLKIIDWTIFLRIGFAAPAPYRMQGRSFLCFLCFLESFLNLE